MIFERILLIACETAEEMAEGEKRKYEAIALFCCSFLFN